MQNKLTAYMLIAIPQFIVMPGFFDNSVEAPRLLIISLGVYLLCRRGTKPPKNPVLVPLLVFLCVNILSLCFAADKWTAFAGLYQSPNHGVMTLALVSMTYLAAGDLENAKKAAAWTGAVLGIVAVAQAVSGVSFWGQYLPHGRAIAFRGSPVFLGASLIPCFLSSMELGKSKSKIFYATAGLALAGMAVAGAKGAILAALAGVMVLIANGPMRWIGPISLTIALWGYLVAGGAP